MKDFRILTEPLRNGFRKLVEKHFPAKDSSVADVERVGMSSRILGMSEFKFFQLAYSRWYGHEISEKQMEPIFTDYMFRNEVPHWARHLSREIVTRHSMGDLDFYEYTFDPVPLYHESRSTFSFLPIFLTFAYLIFYLFLTGSIHLR